MAPRRRSVDSSSSSSCSDSEHKNNKVKESKKDKKDKRKDKHGNDSGHQYPGASSHGAGNTLTLQPTPTSLPSFLPKDMSFPEPSHEFHNDGNSSFPTPHAQAAPPPSGYRIPLTTDVAFPEAHVTGRPPFYDADGTSPVFIGSALMERSVHPCKIGPHLQPFAAVPYGGGEHGHRGRYDLLPFIPEQMEWVPTSHGRIPDGRRPVEGGYEEGGEKLYHAVANLNGVRVPGKTGEHLCVYYLSYL